MRFEVARLVNQLSGCITELGIDSNCPRSGSGSQGPLVEAVREQNTQVKL